MTGGCATAARFDLVELDLLATHAGVPLPYPLRVPSFGRFAAERDAQLAEAGRALAARGLADDLAPRGVAADLVTALREHRGAVDLVVVGAGTVTGVVALVYQTFALVCGQSLGGEASTVAVRRVAQTALADELTAVVPDVPAAQTLPITLPPGVVGDALRLVDSAGDDPLTRSRVREFIRGQGGDPDVLDALTGLLSTVAGRGQLGATRRTGAGSVRAGTELSWLDSPAGRVRVDASDGWTSVNPLGHRQFRLAVDRAAATASEPW
ncbi:ESX secretion-associated protein EspG [Goodfellowiella coeruleoviolacea]|uniref:EspG family protein n=1 Tax=Goodfellowiella coeruleoviolacea TaxID=334858 RepID=A0AAE3GBR5_9PSEU|nr:ESX secretion-associated protein EspG [Goodfellowiella coeruleoviolacea]MCP2163243.1 EspG family protein [Goodfellowiella coeruleoviolacea]